MKEHTIVCNSNGTYSAKLNRIGYVGSANRNPKFAIEQAKREFNADLRMVNAKASDFGVRIRYEMPSQAELDARFPEWKVGS
jgi:hypothetical protein